MITIIESGSNTWAVAATNGELRVFSRERADGWAEVSLTEDSEQIDQDGSLILEALYEQHIGSAPDEGSEEPEAEPEPEDEEEPAEAEEEDEEEPEAEAEQEDEAPEEDELEDDQEPEEQEPEEAQQKPRRSRTRTTARRGRSKASSK